MGTKFTDDRWFSTAANSLQLSGQSTASIAFFLQYEADGPNPPGINTTMILRGDAQALNGVWSASGPNVQANFTMFNNSALAATVRPVMTPGAAYHIALVWTDGLQTAYVNGVPSNFGTRTGTLKASNFALLLGQNNPGRVAKFTLDDVAIWNGYALTPADVGALRDGDSTPDQIGGGASARWYYPLDGTPGNTPIIGDPGLNNLFGTGLNFTTATGAGSSVYVAQLAVVPTVEVSAAEIGTSGKTIALFFDSSLTHTPVKPTTYLGGLVVNKNGNPVATLPTGLTSCHLSPTSTAAVFALPFGVRFVAGDVGTITGPNAFMDTPGGIVAAVNNFPLTNKTGLSIAGVEEMAKTFKPGLNMPHEGTPEWSSYQIPKNWAKRLRAKFGGKSTIDGKPLTLTSSPQPSVIINTTILGGGKNGIDGTIYPGQPGLYAIGWDAPGATTFALVTGQASSTTVTERTDLANPGAGGVGKVRVFDVQRNPTSTTVVQVVRLQIFHATLTPNFSNLRVYGPDDFTHVDNTPTVLDAYDDYALSGRFLDRFQNGIGMFRWVDSVNQFGGITNACEPEHLRNADDFSWGDAIYTGENRTITFTQARPWDAGTSPYVYSDLMGSPFNATLASDIDAVTTTLTISDAATAPVLVGLRLQIDNEKMRVKAVSGTTVTVERGVSGTTAASHSAGTIQVLNRYPVSSLSDWTAPILGSNLNVVELVTSAPHGLRTGQYVLFQGSWPAFTCTNGGTGGPTTNYSRACHITGPHSLVILWQTTGGVGMGTLRAPAALSNAFYHYRIPEGAGYPYEFCAQTTAHFDGADLFCNVPHVASDSMLYEIARRVRDHFPAGRRVWIEVGDEPWNFGDPWYRQKGFYAWVSQRLYPGGFGLEFNCLNSNRAANIFRSVWTTGGRDPNEIKMLLNVQHFGSQGQANSYLNFCRTHDADGNVVRAGHPTSIKVGGICTAPYLPAEKTDAAIAFCDAVDDEQWIDAWMYFLWYDNGSGTVQGVMSLVRNVINNHNATYSQDVKLVGYEGGFANLIPFVPGTPRKAANRKTRNRDIKYNPNNYFAEQLFYALLQLYYEHLCIYAYSIAHLNDDSWGMYHWQGQPYGYGDGRDGKADNRLTLACPGKPNTKPATVNQDFQNVSVRGQALIDWMGNVAPPPP